MATDEPLREDDLPPQLREQGSENSRSPMHDQSQPMIGDLVHRPGDSSEDAARDAMMLPGDPVGHTEQLGLVKPPASDAGAGGDARHPERQDAANKPPSAADMPPVEDAVSAEESARAAAAEASGEESVDAAPDAPPTVSPAASPVSDETSDDGGAALAAVDESLPADGPPADPGDDSDDAVALDSSPATMADEPVVAAGTSSTTGDSSATADAPAPVAAASPPSAPAASSGLAPEQVTSADGSQSKDGELPPRTTEMLTPGADGQPPMARPIVLARLTDDETHRMINDALAKVSADDSALMESIAADHVDYIFWQVRAQERAILRFD